MAKPAGLPELDAVSPDQAISRNTDERADTRDRVRTSVGTVPFQAGCTPCDYYQFHDGRLVRQSERLAYSRQVGVANYGQMTAGGWMYIGPQGIVHGTFNTLLNAGRKKLGIPQDRDLRGHLFVSSGLGGMSGAQPKAAVIAGAASIIAEVDSSRIQTRHSQGWVQHVIEDKSRSIPYGAGGYAGKRTDFDRLSWQYSRLVGVCRGAGDPGSIC